MANKSASVYNNPSSTPKDFASQCNYESASCMFLRELAQVRRKQLTLLLTKTPKSFGEYSEGKSFELGYVCGDNKTVRYIVWKPGENHAVIRNITDSGVVYISKAVIPHYTIVYVND